MERPIEFKSNQEWAEDYIYREEKLLNEYGYSRVIEPILEQMKELSWKDEKKEFITLVDLKDLISQTLKAIKVAENKISVILATKEI